MLRKWWRPLGLTILMTVTVLLLLNWYFQTEEARLTERSLAVTRESVESVRVLIEGRARALQTLAEVGLPGLSDGGDAYLATAEALLHNYDGFYGINLIGTDGAVKAVYPYERNKPLLGREFLGDRSDLAPLLELSRSERRPVLSQKVSMGAGIDAVLIFLPLFEKGRFAGWLSGVVDLGGWMRRYLERRGPQLALRIAWTDPPGAIFGESGPLGDGVSTIDIRVWNQNLRMSAGWGDQHVSFQRTMWSVYGVTGLALILISLLLFGLEFALARQHVLNKRLRLKNALVSSLAHDMGTPLTVLSLGLEKLKMDPGAQATWMRVSRSVETLRQMLESVRLLHAMESGQLDLRTEGVDLSFAVRSSMDHVAEMAQKKRIHLQANVPTYLPPVLAERATLVQNVVPNVLTNAIKFSPSGGVVHLKAEAFEEGVRLSIRDSGVGIPAARLDELLKDEGGSQPGTEGEKGSGLGMIQVKTFMDFYGGSFGIASQTDGPEHGTTVLLTFRKA